ncbi:hypothetical protein SZ64_04385 [Erythrobacter sp. SG61-1L]|uniref:hypothetical protein n=1 Tax=Erythrobacter sp. SG61-1L TaxID=1603897 RepID=UPI0006C8E987|nr:hypothetical protein [Erythrobacter sp. SG61-1L]KPL67408.1 hypothetical protein SZ64_04385 [Erythrobacter sp. SG61-1L]
MASLPITALSVLNPQPSPVEQVLSRFKRRQLEAFITVAIDLIDIIDGDFDLEDDDPDIAADDVGEPKIGILHPVYDIDQSIGPINEVAAVREYLESQLNEPAGAVSDRRA